MVKTHMAVMAIAASLLAALCCALGCERRADSSSPAPAPTSVQPATASARRASAPGAAAVAVRSNAGDEAALTPPIDAPTFARLFSELSEPDRYFFSDNFVSNETSYLQVATLLEQKAMPGGAYLGVGPEQNFSYIAISRPKLAFIVDIRRQNALEHLLYKAIFDVAESRSSFLCALLGATCTPSEDPGPEAELAAVIETAETAWKRRDKSEFEALHERLLSRIEHGYRIALPKRDLDTLGRVHRAFFSKGMGVAFELHSPDAAREYPSFRELVEATSSDGRRRNFLASERDFRLLQRMQRSHRIVPVVGDFAGEHAVRAIAAELRRRDLPVSVFYTSNVEQYLVDPPKWRRWVDNVEALPTNESSLFLRCYLDQGRRHPQQLEGHRSASVLQLFDHFRWKQKSRGYTGFWQLTTDGVITE